MDGHTDLRTNPNCIIIKGFVNFFLHKLLNIQSDNELDLSARYPSEKVSSQTLVISVL